MGFALGALWPLPVVPIVMFAMTSQIPLKDVTSEQAQAVWFLPPAQSGEPIHTRSFKGLFRNLRLAGAGSLMLLFFGISWLDWNGQQAILWDLEAKQFHVFGATFWPQDFILLSAVLMIAAFGLFFITALAGRVWCGYACPQSVWTWMFMWVEKLTEGERHRRIRLDAAPWSVQKVVRRVAKHSLWLAISLATAIGFIGYFTPVRELVSDLLQWQLGTGTAFWLMLFTAFTYFNAGWLREKVCLHMCPYSRFQSVMFDEHTLLVSYDVQRGETRGPGSKTADRLQAGLGDCIDCTLCVQVCPTGIDIRNGLQLDCISCGACIDACNNVMDQLGSDRGLIRYSSAQALLGKQTRWWRPRLMGYVVLLALMVGSLVWGLQARPLIDLHVSLDRGYYPVNDVGGAHNLYAIKILNKSQQSRTYQLSLVESDRFNAQGLGTIAVKSGQSVLVPVRVNPKHPIGGAGSQTLTFVAQDLGRPDSLVSTRSVFRSPTR